MAKHNLFLGTGKGSVGDVTIYRRSGSQVSRVRVRDVANPRTTSQSTQRNFLAPVAKFYAPLAVVLEKSYEGLSKSASYSAFLKKNIEKAKENGWYLDKGTPFFPLPYQVSRGTIKPVSYNWDQNGQVVIKVTPTSQTQTVGAASQAFINAGYAAGDQVTIIEIVDDGEGNYYPRTGRFILEPASSVPLNSIMPGLHVAIENILLMDMVAAAVIVSRFENGQWRRSTQSMTVEQNLMDDVTSEAARKAAIASYGNNVASNDGDVYLDGAGKAFNIAAEDGSALLFYGGQLNATPLGSDNIINLTPVNRSTAFCVKIGVEGFNYLSGADAANPSTWTKKSLSEAYGNASNTIVVESASSDMAQYLMSIGVPAAQLA